MRRQNLETCFHSFDGGRVHCSQNFMVILAELGIEIHGYRLLDLNFSHDGQERNRMFHLGYNFLVLVHLLVD